MKNFSQSISELTEISETCLVANQTQPRTAEPPSQSAPSRGWILYDGECQFCIGAANQFRNLFAKRGFAFIPLQTPWVQQRLGLVPGAPLPEMRVLTIRGDDYGGADAVLFLTNQIWWLRPIAWIGKLPFLHSAVDFAYRRVAARRGCTHLKCNIRGRSQDVASASSRCAEDHWLEANATKTPWLGERQALTNPLTPWGALIILPAVALLVRAHVEPWLFMWFMAGAIFLGCKWLTLQQAQRKRRLTTAQKLAYLFLWPGMDAVRFFGGKPATSSLLHELPNIGAALGKIALGSLLLWGIARNFSNDLVAGWIGMIGMILIIHFGAFSLAACCWRFAGRPARPIMNAPWKASQLSEFWGRRWNRAFQQLVIDTLFRPLTSSIGVVRATLITFFVSGLLHELVISLPAGAGYGLPTGYFLLQGWGIIAQRTPIAGRHRLNNRFFTLVLVAAPAFALFHPPFVRGVIVPFMHAIGAL